MDPEMFGSLEFTFAQEIILKGQELIWPVLMSATLKVTLLLAASVLLALALKRRSAAIRHALWCTALFSSLFFLTGVNGLERWQVPILPVEFMVSAPAAITPEIEAAPLSIAGNQAVSETQSLTETGGPSSLLTLPTVLLFVWLLGVLLVIARLLVGTLRVRRLVREAAPLEDPAWVKLSRELSQQIRLRRRVRLLRSRENLVPLTCGAFSAVVLLPNEADEWSIHRRRVVLLHELIHVRRRDLLTQTLAQLVCALYWFNPLVWFAARRLRKEQEWACDEQVLATGIKASDYAGHLLEIGRGFDTQRLPAVTTTAIMRRSQLEERLRVILKPDRQRSHAVLIKTGSILILCLVFFSLAATQLDASQPTGAKQEQSVVQEQKQPPSGATAKQSPENQSAPQTPRLASKAESVPADAEENQTAEQLLDSFSAAERTRLASNGVGPAYIDELARTGYRKLTVAQLIALYTNAVRADYVASLASVGYAELSPADLIALRSNGITADVIKSFQAVKYTEFRATNYIAFRSNGVTPGYLNSMSALGYDQLTPKQIVDMWVAGVTADFIRDARRRGQTNLIPEELILLARGERP